MRKCSSWDQLFIWFTCRIALALLCSARLQSKMAGDNDKSVVLGVLLSLLALITAFQHQFAIIYNLIFQTQQQRAMILQLNHTATISRFQIVRRKIRCGPACRSWRDFLNCWPFELLVNEYEDPAMLFLRTRPQGHLWFQDGGWANWASWGRLHGGRIILAPGSSFLGWS